MQLVLCALFVLPVVGCLVSMSLAPDPVRDFVQPRYPGLRTLHHDPPVWNVDNFLSQEECLALVDAAESGALPPIPYGRKHKIFTGTKWAAHGEAVAQPFLERCCQFYGDLPAERFEPVTVTRYREGEYQAEHLDARLGQSKRDAAYVRSGGQRLAQLIVYLQEPERGGETRFFKPCFGGLAVPPKAGMALVFPAATLDGTPDKRFLHSGEPVVAGTKWIVGTWLLEHERGDGEEVDAAVAAMWKLARSPPPPPPPPLFSFPELPKLF